MPYRVSVSLCLSCLLALLSVALGSVPEDLSNFQNEYVCDASVRLVRPLNLEDVQEAVKRHSRVVPVGTGHSWNKPFFCPGPSAAESSETTANIVMTTVRPLEINVDEEDMSVWVSAGVTVWDVMSYLGNYVTPSAPRGYALAFGSTPFYVNQTVAGCIATSSHGSSLDNLPLSSQVTGFRVVLANGTLMEIYPDRHPLYFRAFQASVGRLGVVTDVKLRISPEQIVKRTFVIGLDRNEFLKMLRDAQDMYRETGLLPKWIRQNAVVSISPLDLSVALHTFETVEDSMEESVAPEAEGASDLAREDAAVVLDPLDAKINEPLNLSRSEEGGSRADGVAWEQPTALEPNLLYADVTNLPLLLGRAIELFTQALGNRTAEALDASFSFPAAAVPFEETTLHDDYEVAVHVDRMADCFQGLFNFLETEMPDTGLRRVPLLRFVGKENGLLSPSHDKPIAWLMVQDFLSFNQPTRMANEPLRKLFAFLMTDPACAPARLHWGKAGWPDAGCWNGAEFYGENWCHFGCAVRALDPEGKFVGSAPDRWNWNGANLDECCTDHGYDSSKSGCECKVVPLRSADQCPEAPFFT